MTAGEALLPALQGVHGDHDRAVSVAGERISWAELAGRAAATAAALEGLGAVAVEATPTLDTVVAVVSALAAGVPVVPVPADAGDVERTHLLRDSGAGAVLGHPQWPDVALPRVALGRGADEALPPEPDGDAAALIIYTSGTTGAPKGVVLSRDAIAAGLDGLAAAWQWTPDDVLVHGLPLFHVHGLVLGVLGALRQGCRLVHTGRPTPEAYAAAVADGGSLFFGVPTVWGRVAADAANANALRPARLLVSGSAPLPVPVFDRLRAVTGHAPVERYGMTETLITLSTRADGERRPGWVGLPIEGVRTRLVDDAGENVPHDGEAIGELLITGRTMFDGYLGRDDATREAYDGEWFRTGDAASIDAGGFHRIVGRMSMDIIKTGGFKVGAGEVETALLSHPSVIEAAVVGQPDDDLGQRIVAYVVGDAADPATLVEHVATTLSAHKRPREVRVVVALPRNAMGKVQKHLLT
ncbi:MAG TPA: acyl-CoA synthetase [Ilumatobacteraceae bacterium]|nr:acyl-CoA synthetase [Ilumatobacteraceae bacterium]